jgi:predicted nucleic acid-binding protein
VTRRKTYVDAGVLIAAARGENEVAVKAMQILDDPMRDFVASLFLKLEVLPKAVYTNRQAEVEFYETFFAAVSHWVDATSDVVEKAQEIANAFGLGAMDALHVATAISASADELVTTEKPSKPIHRVTDVQVFSIQE